MNNLETLYLTQRSEWRAWLEKYHNNKLEVWLIYPKKNSGKPRILYNDAVEEALCFGWIDSINKKLDEENTIQRFSPRNPKSTFSQPNKERLNWLYRRDMIHKSQLLEIEEVIKEEFIFPKDIMFKIKSDQEVVKKYKTFSSSYQRIRIAFIDSARNRPEEFEKRLNNFLEKTREGKLIKGFGGIEKYY
jgi:uncharacterized protein YdeI (YjbR/CyaY-like superfamily)